MRRLYRENPVCPKVTFAEQVDGLTRRYQRRTPALQKVVDAVAAASAGRGGARLLSVVHHVLSWATMLHVLMRLAPPSRAVPRVAGIDEFALRKGQRYATILIDALTGARIDVLADRKMETVTAWLRAHPGIEVIWRDGGAGYAQAITDADPRIRQAADRWHLWPNLSDVARKEVAAHSGCWGALGPPIVEGKRAANTRERWAQARELRAKGVGLLECARRLNLSMNTVKRYDRAPEPEAMIRAPIYRPTLVDPYREHLRKRRAEDPAVPLTHPLGEITALGYTGSANLLMRYITQGRVVEAEHAALSPKKATGLLLADPASLREDQRTLRDKLGAACPEMTELSALIGQFAAMLTPQAASHRSLGALTAAP